MSAPAHVAHCGPMPCDTGLLLNAIATLSGVTTTLLPHEPMAGADAKVGPPSAHPARPGLYANVLEDRHNSHHERNSL